MAITNLKIDPASQLGEREYCIPITIADSQTGKAMWWHKFGYNFEIRGVHFSCLTETALTNVDLQIGTTSVLSAAISPTAGADVVGALSTTAATIQGTAGSTVRICYTSGGSSALSNGVLSFTVRPWPVGGGR